MRWTRTPAPLTLLPTDGWQSRLYPPPPGSNARAGNEEWRSVTSQGCPSLAPSRQVPPRIHLDLYTEDQEGEVARLLGLGATEVRWDKRPPDADYVILADPEGNRFCVVDKPAP